MRLLSKENELMKKELRDAKAWRLRSKERWFREGEAPSRMSHVRGLLHSGSRKPPSSKRKAVSSSETNDYSTSESSSEEEMP
ncbi:hypothetical protein R1sor_011219 [Riccia sorocarpa]|uniref:Uncharacterized protein n=1 Tax=Riccia sorocarpa TaxID=122646 RepID=A0ABD3I097_9MARC